IGVTHAAHSILIDGIRDLEDCAAVLGFEWAARKRPVPTIEPMKISSNVLGREAGERGDKDSTAARRDDNAVSDFLSRVDSEQERPGAPDEPPRFRIKVASTHR